MSVLCDSVVLNFTDCINTSFVIEVTKFILRVEKKANFIDIDYQKIIIMNEHLLIVYKNIFTLTVIIFDIFFFSSRLQHDRAALASSPDERADERKATTENSFRDGK